jgi:hypothetical protein
MGLILQSTSERGLLRAWITIAELPSSIKRSIFKEQANEIANLAAKASPILGEQEELIGDDM